MGELLNMLVIVATIVAAAVAVLAMWIWTARLAPTRPRLTSTRGATAPRPLDPGDATTPRAARKLVNVEGRCHLQVAVELDCLVYLVRYQGAVEHTDDHARSTQGDWQDLPFGVGDFDVATCQYGVRFY